MRAVSSWRRGALAVTAAAALALLAATRWDDVAPVWHGLVQTRAADDAAPPAAALEPGEARRTELARFLERHPRDGRGWVLLAYAEMQAERFDAAVNAFEKAVAVAPKVAADPAVWCEYADALGMAQGGSLAGRPTELVLHALGLRADHPKALEMAGSAAYERRDFALAAQYWQRLLPQLAAGSQPRRELSDAIARAERLASLQLPPAR